MAEQGQGRKSKCKDSGGKIRGIWKEDRAIACHWREKICVAKAQQELKLASNVGDTKYLKMSISKSSPKITSACFRMKMVTPQTGTQTRQRSLILSLPSSLMLMMAKRVPVSWAVRMVNNLELVWDLLFQLSPYKFMGLDEIHPRTLKELANVFVRSLSMIFFMILGTWC